MSRAIQFINRKVQCVNNSHGCINLQELICRKHIAIEVYCFC